MNILRNLVSKSFLLLMALILVMPVPVWAVTPNCPSGSQLSSDSKACVKDVPPVCKPGFVWKYQQCYATTTEAASCPPGMQLVNHETKCRSVIAPICKTGYTLSADKTRCEKEQDPNCPSGSHWVYTKCIPTHGIQGCPSGSSWSNAKGLCEEITTPTCPGGYTLSGGNCIPPKRTGTAI
jgi:hypothetical protein